MNVYEIVKKLYPIKVTPHNGVNISELIKEQYPDYYKYFNLYFNWNDLDGILDFLYCHSKILHIKEAQQIIELIESNCEIK